MANSFTTNLNLIKPEVGADSDAWGGHYNLALDALDAMLGSPIYGLTLSTAGSSSTYGIAAGGASGMALSSAYTKTTSSWAVGTGNGSLDTGSIANSTWYHVWLIQRTDTSVVDVLISTSATAPTMPSNYDRKRRIGAMKTNGSAQWTKFVQLGDEFIWDTQATDINTSQGTTAATLGLNVPTGLKVIALVNFTAGSGSSAGQAYMNFGTNGDQTISAASSTSAKLAWTATGGTASGQFAMRTDTSGLLKFVASQNSCIIQGGAYGWIDPRGRF